MLTPHSVVVGVAADQPSLVRRAVVEAQRLGRSLRVVHCWAMPTLGAEYLVISGSTAQLRADATAVLDHAASIVAEMAPQLDVELVVKFSAPADVLIDEAREAALLVVGSDDAPWFERFLGGELSEHLARAAKCPVLVVPEQVEPGAGAGGVVVAIDGDTSATGPLRYGFEQAGLRREPLHVLHAAPAGTIGADLETHRANVAEVVAGWQEQFPGVDVVRSITTGVATDACIEATALASLVVVGRHHGHTRPFTWVRPIASTVLRGARCPVVVVPLDYGVTPVHA